MNTCLDQILQSLQRSAFRRRFALRGRDLQYYREKGAEVIRQHADDFIRTRVADPFPKNDGRQTPMRGHPVFIAQHATATCCRGCMRKWHKIDPGAALSQEQVTFIVDLIMRWLQLQLQQQRPGRTAD